MPSKGRKSSAKRRAGGAKASAAAGGKRRGTSTARTGGRGADAGAAASTTRKAKKAGSKARAVKRGRSPPPAQAAAAASRAKKHGAAQRRDGSKQRSGTGKKRRLEAGGQVEKGRKARSVSNSRTRREKGDAPAPSGQSEKKRAAARERDAELQSGVPGTTAKRSKKSKKKKDKKKKDKRDASSSKKPTKASPGAPSPAARAPLGSPEASPPHAEQQDAVAQAEPDGSSSESDDDFSDDDPGVQEAFIPLSGEAMQPTPEQRVRGGAGAGADAAGSDVEAATSDHEEAHGGQSPWHRHSNTRDGFRSSPTDSVLLHLHQEIVEFAEMLTLTPAEVTAAEAALERVLRAVAECWPDARVEVFGSRATGLVVPDSDIDLVVFAPQIAAAMREAKANGSGRRGTGRHHKRTAHLFTLSDKIERAGIASYLEVVDSARIPIIKLRDKESGIGVDICFEEKGGPRTGALIRSWLQEFPAMRPLILVLKYFLAQRGLNEPFHGGVGSFLLSLMVLHVLQVSDALRSSSNAASRGRSAAALKRRKRGSPKLHSAPNLGVLLMRFFEIFGCSLDVSWVGISVRNGGRYFLKHRRGWTDSRNPRGLSIENPDMPSLDVGAAAYNFGQVRRAFEHALHVIRHMIDDRRRVSGNVEQRTPLASLLRVSDELRSRIGRSQATPNHLKFSSIGHRLGGVGGDDTGDGAKAAPTVVVGDVSASAAVDGDATFVDASDSSDEDVDAGALVAALKKTSTPTSSAPVRSSGTADSRKRAPESADAGEPAAAAAAPSTEAESAPETEQPSTSPDSGKEEADASGALMRPPNGALSSAAVAYTPAPVDPVAAAAVAEEKMAQQFPTMSFRRPRLLESLLSGDSLKRRRESEALSQGAAALQSSRPHWP